MPLSRYLRSSGYSQRCMDFWQVRRIAPRLLNRTQSATADTASYEVSTDALMPVPSGEPESYNSSSEPRRTRRRSRSDRRKGGNPSSSVTLKN